MTNPANFAGASLVMVLSPTGLKQSSPRVWRKKRPTSQRALYLQPA